MVSVKIMDTLYFRNRHDELPSPLTDTTHLLHNLFAEIPRKNEEIIWVSLAYLFWRIDGNVHAREEMTLLMRAPVNRVVDEIRSHPTIIEQGIALRRRSVADNPLAFLSGRDEK